MTDKQNFGTLLLLVLAPIPIQPTTSSFLTKRRKKPVFPPKYFPNVLKYLITKRWHNQIIFFVQVWDGAGMADSLRIPPDGQVRGVQQHHGQHHYQHHCSDCYQYHLFQESACLLKNVEQGDAGHIS